MVTLAEEVASTSLTVLMACPGFQLAMMRISSWRDRDWWSTNLSCPRLALGSWDNQDPQDLQDPRGCKECQDSQGPQENMGR